MATLISGSTGVNKITDGTITNADIASGAAIAGSKLVMPAGSVINVYRAAPTGTASGVVNGTWYDTPISITFTPTNASSTFVVWYNVGVDEGDSSGDGGSSLRVKRVQSSTTIYPSALSTDDFGGSGRHAWAYTNGPPTSSNFFRLATVHGYDSETHTTASITYTIQFSSYNRNSLVVGDSYNCQPLITVMEIAG